MFCKHDWELLSSEVTKSKFECVTESLDSLGGLSKIKLSPYLCDTDRKHIQVFSCSKCGRLKRFVEEI